ncbi:MAG: hypothetical protein FJ267_03145 [Planctomycetes bacterium]|nr:hypothetical protein [Planctomycetota bacterium]
MMTGSRNIPQADRIPKRRGFTLVDLTLTMLILSILTAVAAPKLSTSMAYYQVESASRRLEADINFVRDQARASSAPCSITFTTSPPSFTTTGVTHTDNSGRPYSINLSNLGYSISMTVAINGTTGVTFNQNGMPSAGSPLSPVTSGTITVTSLNQSRTVTIDPATGKARRS